MECKEFEKRIPDFMNRKMDYITLKEFAEHVEACEDCKEELTIQFLIGEGLVRLEEGSAFDLKQELWERMHETEKEIRKHDRMIAIGTIFEYLIMALIVGFLISIILK